uniref:Anterior gradient 3, protein disulphide isomerase family member n=1 Tax=Leptobrachium leishanense TaxID=445787 RepID=A0A8C5PRT0_9ANUR
MRTSKKEEKKRFNPLFFIQVIVSLFPELRDEVQLGCPMYIYKTLLLSHLLDSQRICSQLDSPRVFEKEPDATMLFSTMALVLMLFTFSTNMAMAVTKEGRAPQTLSRGWGDSLTWAQTYEEGLYNAKKKNKPLMVIHHLEECQYCQALKQAFSESVEAQELANEQFIMLNIMHETTDKNLAPDGKYVPRILFVDPSLTVRADITGRYSNRLYTYEPQDLQLLIENMMKALRLLQTEL